MSDLLADFWAQIANQLDPSEPDIGAEGWEPWLSLMYPKAVSAGFAPHHRQFWDWLWAIEPESSPRPFLGIWPRGGGKSTAGEIGCAALACRGKRRYVVYVSNTQAQADKRVANIGSLLESDQVASHYPAASQRAVGKFGAPKGWRRNRLHAANGFVVDALGLDTASRGLKVEDQRPDFIVFDDLDERHDSPARTQKKVETIADSIIPMGAWNCAVVAVQNLITDTGVFARLLRGQDGLMIDRVLSGPVPAVLDLRVHRWEPAALFPASEAENSPRPAVHELVGKPNVLPLVRHVITHGTPVWPGQGLEICQRLIDLSGLTTFLREQQHQVAEKEGALWKAAWIGRGSYSSTLKRVVVAVDPSGGRAEIGIIVVGIGYDGRIYVLADLTQPGHLGPRNWASVVRNAYEEYEADAVVAEGNFGGDMVEEVMRLPEDGEKRLPVLLVHASRGKKIRAEPVVTVYQDGRVFHDGIFPELEFELLNWVPALTSDSPNRLDALVWGITALALPSKMPRSGGAPSLPGAGRRVARR